MAKEREFIFKNDVLASNKNNTFGFYSTGTISGKIYFGKTNNSISAYVTVLGEYPNGVVSNIAVVNPSETYLVAKFIPKSKLEPGEHGIRIFDPAGGTVASGLIEFTWKGRRPTSFDHVRYVGPSPDQSISLNAPSHFSSRAAVTTKEVNAVCFVRGTYILTSRGYIQVEHLKLTDFAVTSAGEQHPIKWVGQRTIDCSTYT